MLRLLTPRHRTALLAVALCSASAGAWAQNLPVPGDCGGPGDRACPIGAPAMAVGEPVGAAGMTPGAGAPGAAPGYPAYGGYAGPAAAAPAAGGYGAGGYHGGYGGLGQPGTPPPENGFSWQQRTPDGALQTCRRGLDGVTVRCDEVVQPR